MQNKRKNNQLTSSCSVGMRDINALLSAPISRIGCCPQGRDDEGRRAFTLIELLVVVLIIGILAAVALPQYQKTVIKSQYAKLKTLVASITQAQEAYYLANGHYTANFEELDIDMPGGKLPESTEDKYVYNWGFCKIEVTQHQEQVGCKNTQIGMAQQHRYLHSERLPNARICIAYTDNITDIRSQICKAETGNEGSVDPNWGNSTFIYQ